MARAACGLSGGKRRERREERGRLNLCSPGSPVAVGWCCVKVWSLSKFANPSSSPPPIPHCGQEFSPMAVVFSPTTSSLISLCLLHFLPPWLTHSRVTRRVYDMVRPFSRVDGKYNSAIVHLLSSKQTLAVCSPTIPDEKKGQIPGTWQTQTVNKRAMHWDQQCFARK